ncbi:RNA-guided pseudouridylation complex pseudouridine synthase subunit Cbf5 [Candidatus Pacearchaeota archaeon]|nr:RNA-guided pseudouridylation complex pseudouridine synthase subunit Cbf5 [Candidatus Pacearchaeota archaeon]
MEKDIDLHRSIIVIDKPAGMTSFQVTDFVRKELGINKAGHSGTLDPEVTGVLPILLGRASRMLDYFIHQNKEYVGIAHLHQDMEIEKIKKTIKAKFLGKIMQLPPVKSRVKRQEREREIVSFEILEKHEKDILFLVECEAGTYIRKLIHNLGEKLGIGMHMSELRRTKASIFLESQAVTLYDFTKAAEEFNQGNPEKLSRMLHPAEIITKILPKIEVKTEAIEMLKHGSPLFREMIKNHENFNKGDFLAVMSQDKLVEIAQAELESSSIKDLKCNLVAKPKTVLN